MQGFLFCLDKFRNTALKHRLTQIAVGNYVFISFARFVLSCQISRCKIAKLNTALKHRLAQIAVGNYVFISFARFALSCKISRRKIAKRNAALKH